MEEFKSAMLDLIKYQQEQQLSLQKQQMDNWSTMEELQGAYDKFPDFLYGHLKLS